MYLLGSIISTILAIYAVILVMRQENSEFVNEDLVGLILLILIAFLSSWIGVFIELISITVLKKGDIMVNFLNNLIKKSDSNNDKGV